MTPEFMILEEQGIRLWCDGWGLDWWLEPMDGGPFLKLQATFRHPISDLFQARDRAESILKGIKNVHI